MESLLPEDSALPALLDAIPSFVFITDGDVRILEANRAVRQWLGSELEPQLSPRGGDALRCRFAHDASGGCGTTEFCPACVIRRSVEAVKSGRPAPRRPAHMILKRADRSEDHWFMVSASPLALNGRDLVLLVLDDITQLVELRELLPACPGCGGARDLPDPSLQAQRFLRKHPGFLLAHELCPDCLRKPPPDPGHEDGLEDPA